MPGRMDFDLKFGSASERPRDPDSPFKLLILGDWSGDSQLRPGLDARQPRRVDVDRLDALCRETQPTLALGGAGSAHRLTFHELEDFHPDRIFERMDLFRSLRDLRTKLADPRTFAEAARTIRGDSADRLTAPVADNSADPLTAPAASEAPTSPDATTDTRSDFERLLGTGASGIGAAAAPKQPAAGSPGIEGFLRGLMAPHVSAAPDPSQPLFVAAADQAIGDAMRTILHAPSFQRLEAAWLGLSRLVRSLESEAIEVWIFDLSQDELTATLADPLGTALQRVLVAAQSVPGTAPWSLWAVDFSFGDDAEDLRALAFLGALGAQAGAPVVGAASPRLLGIESFAAEPDPTRWSGPAGTVLETWTELRRSRVAPWIALAAPRLLLRAPYGPKTNPTERFAFEEMPSRSVSDYLWGNAIWGVAEVVGRSFAESGWEMSRPEGADIEDLPLHVYLDAGEKQAQAPAEAFLPERAVDPLLAQGISPLLSIRGRNAARLVRLRSVAAGSVPLEGPWSS